MYDIINKKEVIKLKVSSIVGVQNELFSNEKASDLYSKKKEDVENISSFQEVLEKAKIKYLIK